jgi:hypothetical protein
MTVINVQMAIYSPHQSTSSKRCEVILTLIPVIHVLISTTVVKQILESFQYIKTNNYIAGNENKVR